MHFYDDSSSETKKPICFKQQQSFISLIFEMHDFYITWLYALRFVTCKVSVDVFSLLYSKLLLAKLCLLLFGATFADLHW